MKINSTYLYLLLATLCWILAVLFGFFNQNSQKDINQRHLSVVEQNIQIALQKLQKSQAKIIQKLQLEESNLLRIDHFSTEYPFFIYQNESLKFWSDYRFVPEYEDIKGNYLFKLIQLPSGIYVFHKSETFFLNDSVEVYSYFPLYQKYKVENAYLKSSFNSAILSKDSLTIVGPFQKSSGSVFIPHTNEKLFGFEIHSLHNPSPQDHILGVSFLVFAGFVFGGLYILSIVRRLERRKKFEWACLIWLLYGGLIRSVMLYFHFPNMVAESFFFDPKIYASSSLNPSVGDLLLNVLFISLWMSYVLSVFSHTYTYRWLLASSSLTKHLISWGLMLGFVGLGYRYFELLGTIFLDSKLRLDITQNMEFDSLSLLGIIVYLVISFAYFLTVHGLVRLILQISRTSFSSFSYKTALLLLVSFVVWGLRVQTFWVVVPILISWLLLLQRLGLSRYLMRFNTLSSIYLFINAFAFACIGTYAVYHFGNQKDVVEKTTFANLSLPENDGLTENFLAESIEKIKKDPLIIDFFQNPAIPRKPIFRKIQKQYLGGYFNAYEIKIHFFDAPQGNLISAPIDENIEPNFFAFVEKYQKIPFDTGKENIWFIDNPSANLLQRYMGFVELRKKKNTIGYIILDLKQRKGLKKNVYPELLIDKNYLFSNEAKKYSYAVFNDTTLMYSVGNFNYEKDFNTQLFAQEKLIIQGIKYAGYEHLAIGGGFKKKIVVSSEDKTTEIIFSNFSFQFLSLVICIVGVILGYSLVIRWQGIQVNFATRIQTYLNVAFFLPLFVVSITTLGIISMIYQEDFERSFIRQTETAGLNILPHLENYLKQKINRETFSKNLMQIAQNVEADINLFDVNGQLILSSQPVIYEQNSLLAPYINPVALQSLLYDRNKAILLNESVGNLEYQSVYIPLKSYTEGGSRILGFVSIPFFDSKIELNQKLIKVLSTILNIFATIFIVFVALSYFASQILTIPLRLVTQQIRKTTFSNYHEPLVWNSEDEIGLFVREYNKMLRKLDRSKDDLARSQRETAWREIAQQVAHEIKNPLTPMKLTLQHMQVRLQHQGDKVKNLFERSFETLLSQIEILSDIATSFSSFAKMPIPISERFEMGSVLRDTQNLYTNEDIKLTVLIESGEFYVRGDKKLMGRIFTNLIKNAIEAVPSDRQPDIYVSLTNPVEGLIMIEVKDNGTGIPEEVQEKIFMPNFSTKSSGTGIGLAIAKRGIEHAGGRIWFETLDETGTSFFMELPLVE